MALCAIFFAAIASASMPDMATMQRDLDRLATVSDPFSVRLTDQNYGEVRNGSMWLVNFCHPKAMHCKLLNVPWKTLAQETKEEHKHAIIARVEPEDGLSAFRAFAVSDVPTILVFTSGYVYNYTGKLEPRQLRELLTNDTFLMYDRRILSPGLREVRFWAKWGYWSVANAVEKHPACVAGTGVSILLCVSLLFYFRHRRIHRKVD